MAFGLAERRNETGPALLDPAGGGRVSHAELYRLVTARAQRLSALAGGTGLLFLAFAPTVDAVVTYLACLEAGLAVMPLPPELPAARLTDLIGLYHPEIIVGFHPPEGGYDFDPPLGLWRRIDTVGLGKIHPDLALLLSTSGSMGSPKAVRLTLAAVEANARQIVQCLGIGPAERAPTTLPLSYSYGLSVLNSHVMAGATVILTQEGLTSRRFWQVLAECGATSFAGVPASYDLLRRLDLETLLPPSLTTLTQAGGPLAPALTSRMRDLIAGRGGKMFVMYGQTEACARMAVLPPEDLPRCLGAAGRALPEGHLCVMDEDGDVMPVNAVGRIRYSGPNVMMGYGQNRTDLALGDQMGGTLDTGDMGYLDADGVLWITGRHKRMAKLTGLRVNLDEVETLAAHFGQAAVIDAGEALLIVLAAATPPEPEQKRDFARRLGLHSSQIRWRVVERLPLNGSGKIDYAALGQAS